MQGGLSPTIVKGTVFCFQGIWVVLDCLREFYPWLMFDDMKDLSNRQLQGVKAEASSVFTIVGGAFF